MFQGLTRRNMQELSVYLFFLIIVSLFAIKTLNGGVLYFDDGFFPFNPQLSFIQNISSWNSPFFPGGSYYGNFYYIPFIVSIWFFTDLGLSFSTSDALYLLINLFAGAVGIYMLSKFITLNYILKNKTEFPSFFVGPILASIYYIFNYEQMTYYGGEFYQGFILINLTPLFIYLVLKYLSTESRYGIWNRYLPAVSITALVLSGGLNGADAVGTDVFWFFVIIAVTLIFFRFLDNGIVERGHFYIKSFAILVITVLSIAWVIQAVLFGSVQAYSYATTTSYQGKIIITEAGLNPLLNLKDLLSSGYYVVNSSFGIAGPNRMWYAPEEFIRLHPYFAFFTFIPVILSFTYVPFLRKGWLKRKNLTVILFSTFVFYLFTVFIVSKNYLLIPNNLITDGINFSLGPLYSLYPFVIMTAICLAFSVTILQISISKHYSKGYQTHFLEDREIHHLGVHASKKKIRPYEYKVHRQQIKNQGKRTIYLHNPRNEVNWSIMFIISILVLLFVLPIANNPLENWQYDNKVPISGSFQVNKDFNEVGNFLSAASPYGNVLYLPITVSPNADQQARSSFMIVSPPFSPYFDGESINEDPGPVSTTFAYPLLKNFPSEQMQNITNYLDLLGINYIVVNTAEYPTWVSAPVNEFSGGGPPWNFTFYLKVLNESSGIKYVTSIGPYYIYKVVNATPMVYSTYPVPYKGNDSPSPSEIFNLSEDGTIRAGKFSLINSSAALSQMLSSTAYIPVSVVVNSSVVRQYNLKILNDASSGAGYYDQVLVIDNYTQYGINSDVSNFLITEMNGSVLYSWIQYHNSTTLVLWSKVPYGVSNLKLDVFQSSVNLLSAVGTLGEANSSYDNIAQVFPSAIVNEHLVAPTNGFTVLFPGNYNGFGVVVKSLGNMNFSDTPFVQMTSQQNVWNPWWEFYSPTTSYPPLSSSNVSTIIGSTDVPITQFKFGYMYVYNESNGSQNTIESTNGYFQSLSGDKGHIISSFHVWGGRGVNITLSDAFQFNVPNGGMPMVTIGSENEFSPAISSIEGPSELKANSIGKYSISLSFQNGSPLNKAEIQKIGQRGRILVYDGPNLVINDTNFSYSTSGLNFNITLLNPGYYSVIFRSNLNSFEIISSMIVSVAAQSNSSGLLLSLAGPTNAYAGKQLNYTLYLNDSNGKQLNLTDTEYAFKNITIGVLNGANFPITLNSSVISAGKVSLKFTFESPGIFRAFVSSY
ncbi:MAG: hypothetical protein QXP36_04780, partial [Conexivisphaerales archaeon]